MMLSERAVYDENVRLEYAAYFVLVGAFFVFFIYHFLLSLTFREKTLYSFCLYLLLVLGITLATTGLGHQYFWPEHGYLQGKWRITYPDEPSDYQELHPRSARPRSRLFRSKSGSP